MTKNLKKYVFLKKHLKIVLYLRCNSTCECFLCFFMHFLKVTRKVWAYMPTKCRDICYSFGILQNCYLTHGICGHISPQSNIYIQTSNKQTVPTHALSLPAQWLFPRRQISAKKFMRVYWIKKFIKMYFLLEFCA